MERARGGHARAEKIRAEREAGLRPPRRRRRSKWSTGDPAISPLFREPAPPPAKPPPMMGPGLDAQDEARLLARRRGGFEIDLWRMFRWREHPANDLEDV